MSTLTNSSSVAISSYVTQVIPSYETIKVENRCLDGTFHIQTIGTPARICTVEFICLEAGKILVDTAEGSGESLTITGASKYYTGAIRKAPDWNRVAPGLYKTTIILLVSAEGAV